MQLIQTSLKIKHSKIRWLFRRQEILLCCCQILSWSSFPSYPSKLFYHKSALSIRNICLSTGVVSKESRKIKLSRQTLRNQLSMGNLFGFRKAVW